MERSNERIKGAWNEVKFQFDNTSWGVESGNFQYAEIKSEYLLKAVQEFVKVIQERDKPNEL